MGETSDEIERHIQETRNDLSDNFNELEEKVKTAVDWRAQFEERPGMMLGLAFGGGVLLSALLPSLRSRRRSSEDQWEAPANREVPDFSSNSRTESDDKMSRALETWGALKGALVGVAASKLSDFVEDMLPGFKQEFTNARTGKSSGRSVSSGSGQPAWQKANAAGAD
jgi:hypothetical protein